MVDLLVFLLFLRFFTVLTVNRSGREGAVREAAALPAALPAIPLKQMTTAQYVLKGWTLSAIDTKSFFFPQKRNSYPLNPNKLAASNREIVVSCEVDNESTMSNCDLWDSITLAQTRQKTAMEDAVKALMEEQRRWIQQQILEQNQRIEAQQQQQMMTQLLNQL
ncbi:hypothetical protein Cgig2_026208 [Carnegiea gigantea]|uniref:Uncharacterized protein n=1 Tax=Carnegiea gigantea TaxID=171969 RepID=A0A9Q1GUM4_9CARY|nr:hypothetical protein Cgig2_026208 [Carnegiea gigantea]